MATQVEPHRARSPRDLPPEATFADLATAARRQDALHDLDGDAGCLLRRTPAGPRLEADLAVAVRPLPEPASDLDARLAEGVAPVSLLTRFGTYGTSTAPLGLVAMTTTRPAASGHVLALFLTDEGLYARRSERAEGERTPSRPAWVLEHTAWDDVDLVVVTAEAGVPVDTLLDLLDRLPDRLAGRVGLAVPLAPGTQLPPSPSADAAVSPAALCPEGLDLLPDAAPEGDLPADRLRTGLAPLARDAELCVGTSAGAGAAGGRVVLALRIDPTGRVQDACAMEDATGDPALRACLLEATRTLGFDPPGGFLDLALPLRLEPGLSHRQRPVCR